ncbi:hypothetical protein BaRGS_00032677, partial [Batillaria attramentaria]
MSSDGAETTGSGRTFLDSVSAVFEQNHKERQKRIEAQRVRSEVARAHSQYLQRNVVSPIEFRAAHSTVAAWTKKNDVVSKALKSNVKRLQHARRNLFSPAAASSGRGHHARSFLSQPIFSMDPAVIEGQPLQHSSRIGRSAVCPEISSTVSVTATNEIEDFHHKHTQDGEGRAAGGRSESTQSSESLSSFSTTDISCTTISDSEDNDDTVYLSDEESDDGPFSCSVINCWATFSRKEHLTYHMECSNHSPCNPAATLLDGQLDCPPQSFMCPSCGLLCQERLACQEHMVMCDHLPMFSPLSVVAFGCPECMALFPDQVTCDEHMSSQKHQQAALLFKDDCHDSAAPVPVPKSFAEELIQRCTAEPSTVQCIDCDTDISTDMKWQQHQQDYGQQHTFVAHSATTPVDIVFKFLADKMCAVCTQVLYLSPGATGKHRCAEGLTGSATDMHQQRYAMYSRAGIAVYRRGAAIAKTWRRPSVLSTMTPTTQTNNRPASSDSSLEAMFPRYDNFVPRHIGPNEQEQAAMLEAIGMKDLEELTQKAVPSDILLDRSLDLPERIGAGSQYNSGMLDEEQQFGVIILLDDSRNTVQMHEKACTSYECEFELLNKLVELGAKNQQWRTYMGMGYFGTRCPTTIVRNIFENPGWTTQYTPYQAELAQGRLESLLNYQTMITDLTGLDVSNASLLDEGSAAAEAMSLCERHTKRKKFFIDQRVHPQTISVVKTRASVQNIEVIEDDWRELDMSKGDFSGVLIQYPNTDGHISDFSQFVQRAHDNGTLVVGATDLLALTIIKPPGEMGMDIAIGSNQRFGLPLGYGGPHAGFFATKTAFLRTIPGRVVGVTRDAEGRPAYRLALQTREQHIRRDKATSNICTAQALLANMSAMYAIYHGPKGLQDIATRIHNGALILAEAVRRAGHTLHSSRFFDTVKFLPAGGQQAIRDKAVTHKINLRYYEDGCVSVSLDETVSHEDLEDLFDIVGSFDTPDEIAQSLGPTPAGSLFNSQLSRKSAYLTHPVFNTHHSETQLVRYMKKLENKDLSLVHSMISLGSCTMKLNSTTEMMPCTWKEYTSIHPFAPREQPLGYHELLDELEVLLCEITGYDEISFQPNSGAQGEYAGLRTIMAYHQAKGEHQRNMCLIPVSAHGTNPASAQMAGMKITPINVDRSGAVDMSHMAKMVEKYKDTLACFMITYPSTHGVFDRDV